MRKTVCLLMILSLLISCICGASAESRSYTLTDAAGRTVTLEDAPKRVVSGYYISSSLMIALHAEELICGIEAKADTRPIYALAAPELLTLPDVGSVKSFSLEACLAADPDLVILPLRLKSVAAELEGMNIPVLLVDPEDISSLEEMIRLLGAALDREAEADALLSYNRQLSEDLTAKLQNAPRPDVYLAGNSDYLRTAGSGMYQNEMILLAGGNNAAAALGGSSWADISYEQLLAWDPEFIILAPEAAYEAEDVLTDPELSSLQAVKNGCVFAMPDSIEAWDSPVPSTLMGSLWMASVLHPELISPEEWQNTVTDFYLRFYRTDVHDLVQTEF